ncbi:MAG: SDR family oxidoreductase [Candidatus Omnitrophica bacterium]|nr:SDR family oxidoreductase [Candidatus Omnitrophota bacterium]MCM8792960.1 SDR family oxidoreductase [Candidatus Omnitrophota bacterium]
MAVYLVTGGAGFIGSHLVETLLKQGEKVRILDNFVTGKRENLSFLSNYSSSTFSLIEGDIRDLKTCEKACRGVDYVLHQAALRSVPKSMKYPLEYNEVNIQGTLNILLASKKMGVKRVVYASSSSVYGDTDKFPEKENFLPHPISPYAASKLAGEYYCQVFSSSYGLETVSLRYFNVFGPRQSLESQYAIVVPKFITSLLYNQSPPIYGDGKQSRDFTYIDNVIKANLLAVNKKGINGEVFNIASGRDYSVLDLLRILNKIMHKKIKPEFLPPRQGDVKRTWADISKAKKLLGFVPEADFPTGLERTVAWFKEKYNPSLKRKEDRCTREC